MKKTLLLAAAAALCLGSASAFALVGFPPDLCHQEGALLYCNAPAIFPLTSNSLPIINGSLSGTAMPLADVTIPVGEWAQGLGNLVNTIAVPLVGLLVAWFARKVPAAYVTTQNRAAVEQLLEKSIQFAVNKAILLAPDKVTIPVSSDIIAHATQYAVDQAPKVVAWAGGSAAIEDKILARLKLTPSADVIMPVTDAKPAT